MIKSFRIAWRARSMMRFSTSTRRAARLSARIHRPNIVEDHDIAMPPLDQTPQLDNKPYIASNVAAAPLLHDENFANLLLRAFWSHAQHTPDRAAMIDAHDRSRRVTYSQLYNHSLSIASYLQRRGFLKGDVFAIVLPNGADFVTSLVGGTLLGGACSAVSTAFKPFELERQFKDSRARVVIVAAKKLEEVREAIKNCPWVELVIVADTDAKSASDVSPSSTAATQLPFGFVSMADVLKTPPMLNAPPPSIDAKRDLVSLPYSSGTTGVPKGVMLTHENLGTMVRIVNWYNVNMLYPTVMPDNQPRTEAQVIFMPFSHVYGMSLCCVSLMEGYTVVALQQFDFELFCQSIQDFKAQQLYGVPPVFLLLAKHPAVDKYDLSSLVYACTGAAPIGVEVCTELKRRLKLRYVGQGWGMSETSMASFLPDPRNENFTACGYLLPMNEAKVIDISTGNTLPKNVRGELCIRAPNVMVGYLHRPAATAQTLDRDGWLHTGDIGYFDEQGAFYVVDRIKELIKVKGLQVAPAELEDLLLGHPKIGDVAVIGIEDKGARADAGEELPKAFVVRKDPTLTVAEVQTFVKDRVAHYKQLTGGVEFVDLIPKSPSGKLLRRQLRDRETTPLKARL